MRMLKYKVFSYPYLADFTNDYVGSSFTIDVDRRKQRNKLLLTVSYELTNSALQEMVDSGKIRVAIKVTSSTVATSKAFAFSRGAKSIPARLDSMEFEKEVSIAGYLIAEEDFYIENPQLSPVWSGVKAFVQKGNLIGESNEEVIRTDRHKEGETTSIFSFAIGKGMQEGDPFKIQYENERIVFSMSKEDHQIYNRIQFRAPESIVSGILFPCLVDVLSSMKEEEPGEEGMDATNDFNRRHQGRTWYQVIVDRFQKKHPEDDPTHTGIPVFLAAQELLSGPLSKLFTFSEQAVKKGQVTSDE